MTAFDELVTSLVTGGMEPSAAASLVARAVIEATARQKTSGAARTARWRERHKASQSVTEASPRSAVTVTLQASQSVTCDAINGESAPISKKGLSIVSKEIKKKEEQSKKPRARGTHLAADWQPSSADREYAAKKGLRLFEIENEAEKFRNYWVNRTDRQASKPRWDLAWRNWILNVRPSIGQKNNVIAAADELVELTKQWERKDELQQDVRGGEGSSHVRLLSAHRGG